MAQSSQSPKKEEPRKEKKPPPVASAGPATWSMLPAVKPEDVTRAALQLEQDGRRFYLEAAARAQLPQVREVFRGLAADELRHIEWLKQNAPAPAGPVGGATTSSATVGAETRALYAHLRGIFAAPPPEAKRKASLAADDLAALKLGIGMEEQSRAAYASWAKEARVPELRELCRKLAGIEAFHRQALENTIEYLEHPGDWFMQEEGWIFDGG